MAAVPMFKAVKPVPGILGAFRSVFGAPQMYYETGGTYNLPDGSSPALCVCGFHACEDVRVLIANLKRFGYDGALNPDHFVLIQVLLSGTVVTDGIKSAGSCMTVVSAISWADAVLGMAMGSDVTVPWTDPSSGTVLTFRANGDLAHAHYPADGKDCWYFEGRLHREHDQPAIEYAGDAFVKKEWWWHGKRHRGNDKPALIDGKGGLQWWWQGNLHREGDMPAVQDSRETRYWFQHGKVHREGDGPAIIRSDTSQEWWQNGKCHREGDKPAVVFANGTQEWWREGKRHRKGDQPAVVFGSGTLEWWWEGKQHRDGDEPAIIRTDGTKNTVTLEWWQHGKRHRNDGKPAVIRDNGDTEWWRDGKQEEV